MEPIVVFFLVLLPVVALALLLLTWAAYAGRTKLLWSNGGGVMAGGRYWFVLSPALMVGDVLIALTLLLLRVNPETEHILDASVSPIRTSLTVGLVAFLILAIAASYWLPERLKPLWIRQDEAQENEARAARKQARRRESTTSWPG
jgi:hypothetical protein